MATFVEAGKVRINIETVSYVEIIDGGITVHFVGDQPAMLAVGGEDATAFMQVLDEAFTKKPKKKTELPSVNNEEARQQSPYKMG